MYSLEFLASIREQIDIYRNYPAPVVICDAMLNVGWINLVAKDYKEFADAILEPAFLFEEFDQNLVIEKIMAEGSFYAKGLIPLSYNSVVLLPVFEKEKIVAIIGVFNDEKNFDSDVYHNDYTSPTTEHLSKTLRQHLNKIFTATNNLSLKSDILKAHWVDYYLGDIDMECYQILRISDNIAAYALLQSKEAVLTLTAFDLTEWLEVILLPIKELAIKVGVEVELISTKGKRILTVLDEEWFQQMLFNVIHNSIFYTRENNKITIELKMTNKELTLKIKDRGLGISADILPYVTKPYYSSPPLGQLATVGLGLTVAKRVAALHGGSLIVESVENEGTTVTIIIPFGSLPDTISFAQEEKDRLRGSDRYSSPVYTGLTSALATPYFKE